MIFPMSPMIFDHKYTPSPGSQLRVDHGRALEPSPALAVGVDMAPWWQGFEVSHEYNMNGYNSRIVIQDHN